MSSIGHVGLGCSVITGICCNIISLHLDGGITGSGGVSVFMCPRASSIFAQVFICEFVARARSALAFGISWVCDVLSEPHLIAVVAPAASDYTRRFLVVAICPDRLARGERGAGERNVAGFTNCGFAATIGTEGHKVRGLDKEEEEKSKVDFHFWKSMTACLRCSCS